tara:strand:+ start:96 stop:242 length:147 start_codon:yes stop_codon:yes gene_type:complete
MKKSIITDPEKRKALLEALTLPKNKKKLSEKDIFKDIKKTKNKKKKKK